MRLTELEERDRKCHYEQKKTDLPLTEMRLFCIAIIFKNQTESLFKKVLSKINERFCSFSFVNAEWKQKMGLGRRRKMRKFYIFAKQYLLKGIWPGSTSDMAHGASAMHQEIDYNLKSEKRDHVRIKNKGKYKIIHICSWKAKYSKQTLVT